MIKSYFGFDRRQRNGLLVLAVISFVLLIVRLIYPLFIQPADIRIENLPLVERRVDSAFTTTNGDNIAANETKSGLFYFDPNTVSHQQLLSLGFKEKTATTFLKYRSKGFVFKKKEDLKKIYGVSEACYARLEPFITITKKEPEVAMSEHKKNVAEQRTSQKPEPKTIELNSCDSVGLIGLNGIGPSYARRILKYRALLGGYVSAEQLKEVYGFPPELLEKIKPQLTINTTLVKKINLNTDDFKILNRHPYLGYELTKTVFNQRKKGGVTAENLKSMLNNEVLYQKLLPYLAF